MNDPRTHWGAVATLLVAGLFSAAQFGKFTLTLDLLVPHYGGWSGLMVSVVGTVGIIFGVIAGTYVARFGLRRAMICALCAGAVLSVMQMLLPSHPIMIALRIAEGFSHLSIVIAAPTLMSALSNNRDRPVVMGIWASFFGVALALLALLLPALIGAGGLPAVLLFHGLGMAVMAVAVRLWVPVDDQINVAPPRFVAEHLIIYRTPAFVIAGGGFVFYTLLYIALIAVLPAYLGLHPTQTAALPLVSLIGTFGAGFLARYHAPPLITLIGFAAVGFSLIGVFASPSLFSASVLFLSAGLIPGGCFATIPYFNASTADRVRATGAIAQLGNVGTTLGTPLFVFAAAIGGLIGVVGTGLACVVSGISVLIWLWNRTT